MGDIKTGWELENRTHFDEIVVNYDKIRPECPGKLFTDIFDYIGTDKAKNTLEIGAGTGKATIPFLDAGYDVTAVEISVNMVKVLRDRFKDYNKFKVINTAFEDALLEENTYDLIYAVSAFHWVNAQIGCPKVLRLLKTGGAVALICYTGVLRYAGAPGEDEETYEKIQEIYKKYFHKPYKKPLKISKEIMKEPDEIFKRYGFKDLRDYGFTDISINLYDASRIFNADEYITLLDTYADHRNLPENDKRYLYEGIKEVILKNGGCYKMDNIFQLYMGRKKD